MNADASGNFQGNRLALHKSLIDAETEDVRQMQPTMNADNFREFSDFCKSNKKPQPDVDRTAVVFKLNFD